MEKIFQKKTDSLLYCSNCLTNKRRKSHISYLMFSIDKYLENIRSIKRLDIQTYDKVF